MPERLTLPIHGPEHVPGGPDPIPFGDAIFEIKVFEDDEIVTAGDGKFKFAIPEDLDGAILSKAEAWVTGASGSGTIIVQLRNESASVDMLSTELHIDAGDSNSKDSATPHVVDPGAAVVAWGDEIWINVDNAGSGALGLGVAVYFISAAVNAIVLRGARGEPGGVTEFEGDWSGSSVSYPAGTVVVHDGIAYLSTSDHTSDSTTEPGVGVDWETVWATLVDVPMFSGIDVVIASNYPIIEGVKAVVKLPFDGTIVEGAVLADVAGDVEVDIWKTDFASYPPDVSDSITGGNPLALVGSIKNVDTTLTGWDVSLAEGDLLSFVTDRADFITRLTVALKIAK